MIQKLLPSIQLIAVGILAVSCAPDRASEPDVSTKTPATAGATTAEDSSYGDSLELVSIGGERLKSQEESASRCDQRPFRSVMLLSDTRWVVRDSLFIDCPSPKGGGRLFGRLSSGRLEQRGDTLVFLADDPSEGENGVVFVGVRGDATVRVLGTDDEGRDFLYRAFRAR